MTSAPGLFRIRNKSCIPAAFGIENGLLHPRLYNIGATQNTMKLFYTVIFFSLLASAALAREESILARVTSYWVGEGESGKYASTGGRLRAGHCAVDPKRIPYGSKVVFPDRACTAVDTGPAVISRRAARACGRTASQIKAIVVDRFFETKREAIAWTNTHAHFMTLQIVRPGPQTEPSETD
jgi:3D (Asp-Asp-Asp) domain-containing protein